MHTANVILFAILPLQLCALKCYSYTSAIPETAKSVLDSDILESGGGNGAGEVWSCQSSTFVCSEKLSDDVCPADRIGQTF
jgi:hypothetical protein